MNAIGGLAVLVSYAQGVGGHPELSDAFWGDVPAALKPLYTVNMVLAAIGYFPFTAYILFRLGARGGASLWPFVLLYAGILIPSAAWLPLTIAMLEAPSAGLWVAIRVVLFCVGASAVGVLMLLARQPPTDGRAFYRAALIGLIPFILQTAVLDALVWPWFFPHGP